MNLVIVSGSRYATTNHFSIVEAAFLAEFGQSVLSTPGHLVHGDADGIDRLAAAVVEQWGWRVTEMPAEWQRCDDTIPVELGGCPPRPHLKMRGRQSYCPFAGPRRNQQMLDTHPHASGLCFPARGGGVKSGTGDFIDRAIRAGLIHQTFPIDVDRPQRALFSTAHRTLPAPVSADTPTA